MQILERPWGAMHMRQDGPCDGPLLVFANSLGTDLRIWDAVVARLPGWRIARFDKPGHGLSDRNPTTDIDSMADDAAALIAMAGGRAVFVGLSIGGLIGQSLATRHPGLLRALVLSNTAARIGTAESWAERILAVETAGLASIADGVMEKWFSARFRATPELAPWRNMLIRSDAGGYADACRAIAAADYRDAVGRLQLPVLAIAGTEDGSTPPDLVRDTAARINGAQVQVIDGAGHIPCVEAPNRYADILKDFLKGLPDD